MPREPLRERTSGACESQPAIQNKTERGGVRVLGTGGDKTSGPQSRDRSQKVNFYAVIPETFFLPARIFARVWRCLFSIGY